MNQSASISALIWSVADLLRGDYKPADYGKVILPFTVLRRIDCVLAPTKAAVLDRLQAVPGRALCRRHNDIGRRQRSRIEPGHHFVDDVQTHQVTARGRRAENR